jgi:homoserine kinase type II
MDEGRVEETVREILSGYDTGRLLSVTRISSGFANINYLAETENGKFVIRICRQRNAEELLPEIRLAAVLQRHSIPTPQPLPTRSGEPVLSFPAGPVILFPYIEGEHPAPTPGVLQAVGQLLARLHTIPPEEVPYKANPIRPGTCREMISGSPTACLDESLQQQWLTAYQQVEPCLERKLPAGLIHGDLFPDNILFRDEEPVALLDLEEFALDTLLFDIGMTINGFCFSGNRQDPQATEHFLASYEEIRPLTPEEKECLDAWIVWSALGMACWHIRDCRDHGPQPGQKERIRELIERTMKKVKRQKAEGKRKLDA